MTMIYVAAQQAFGAAACPFLTEQAVQLGALATQVVRASTATAALPNQNPGGVFYALMSANDVLEYTPDAGVTFRTCGPAGTGQLFNTDGYNWRLRNTGVADSGGVATRLFQIQGM